VRDEDYVKPDVHAIEARLTPRARGVQSRRMRLDADDNQRRAGNRAGQMQRKRRDPQRALSSGRGRRRRHSCRSGREWQRTRPRYDRGEGHAGRRARRFLRLWRRQSRPARSLRSADPKHHLFRIVSASSAPGRAGSRRMAVPLDAAPDQSAAPNRRRILRTDGREGLLRRPRAMDEPRLPWLAIFPSVPRRARDGD
jgi:hypothetical protein